MSMNLCPLCMLYLSTEFKVWGSKHTHYLPLGFTTSTKACTQSDVSFISNFCITFIVLSNPSFNESLRASGTLLGEHITGVVLALHPSVWQHFWWCQPIKQVWVQLHNMGFGIGLIDLCVERKLEVKLNLYQHFPFSIKVNSLVSATHTFLHLQLSSHCMTINLKSIQSHNPSNILVSRTSVT